MSMLVDRIYFFISYYFLVPEVNCYKKTCYEKVRFAFLPFIRYNGYMIIPLLGKKGTINRIKREASTHELP